MKPSVRVKTYLFFEFPDIPYPPCQRELLSPAFISKYM